MISEEVVSNLMRDLDVEFDKQWDTILGGRHVYSLSIEEYAASVDRVAQSMRLALVKAEGAYIKLTPDPTSYPNGCIVRANRSAPLWNKWDAKYGSILPSWKVYGT